MGSIIWIGTEKLALAASTEAVEIIGGAICSADDPEREEKAMPETQIEQQERIAQKMKNAKWPDDVPEPETQPKLRLNGSDPNALMIIGKARNAARAWTEAQREAFSKLAMAGDYDHVLQTCMRYFDVS